MVRRVHWWPLAAAALLACGGEEPRGLRATPPGNGPVIRWDPAARPLPDIPFPNDVATRLDDSSPTGRRLNVSLVGDHHPDRQARGLFARLDGFGAFQPVTVGFSAPLDLDDLAARHQANLDFADDAVFLVAVDPRSPDFGEPVLLDMGRGNYPAIIRPDTPYLPSDPRQGEPSLLFETVDEDVNGNGALDPGEDGDGDGVLDRPNVWPEGTPVKDGLLTFYERATDTLLIRQVVPLRGRTTYAVILTSRLRGRDGQPVRSPFPYVNALDQTPALSPLEQVFAQWRARGIPVAMEDVAFAWTFTTQTITADLVAIREGLYGHGPLGWLKDRVPAGATPLPALDPDQPPPIYVLDIEVLKVLVVGVLVPAFGISDAQAAALVEDLDALAYVAQVRLSSPDFLAGKGDRSLFLDPEGNRPWDWHWEVDPRAGTAEVEPRDLVVTLAIPKTTARFQPPFPVAVYAHGFGQARVEMLGFAGVLAKYGIASAAIDGWGHGIYVKPGDREAILDLARGFGFGPFVETFLEGRARDVTGDGKIDAGADMFSSYAFHTRDTIRQAVVDHLQVIRMLRGFDGTATWALDQDGDGRDDLAGDFDGDGTVDAGGAVDYFFWGSSMGGITSGVVGALEPAVVATAPVAGGAGLTNLTARSQQASVVHDTVLRVLGPVVSGEPVEGRPGAMRVSVTCALARRPVVMAVGDVDGAAPGFRIAVTNLRSGEVREAPVREGLLAMTPVSADVGDRLEIVLRSPAGVEVARLAAWTSDVTYGNGPEPTFRAGDPLAVPCEGWGYRRQSPELRRLVGLSQMALEPADPIHWARHFFREPLAIAGETARPRNLLILATIGDNMDPPDIHYAQARAAGILPFLETDPRYGRTPNDWLIANHVFEGICGLGRFPPGASGQEVLFDPDRLDDLGLPPGQDGNGFDAPSPEPGQELRVTVRTPTGVSGMRHGHMQPCGKHSFFITDPSNRFNVDEYLNSLAGLFFATRGGVILDDRCHEDSSCAVP